LGQKRYKQEDQPVEYQISMTRKTYETLCLDLEMWGDYFAVPGRVVLNGSLRSSGVGSPGVTTSGTFKGEGAAISKYYKLALHALMTHARVHKTKATIDLRFLEKEEIEALLFAAREAPIRGPQKRSFNRIAKATNEFRELPEMVRLALAVD